MLDIIGESLDVHKLTGSPGERRKRVEELLDMVGLDPAFALRYPHEFSGDNGKELVLPARLQ